MKDYFVNGMSAIDKTVEVCKKDNILPTFTPIRVGIDGATITYMGFPCPNLATGEYNCHGKY